MLASLIATAVSAVTQQSGTINQPPGMGSSRGGRRPWIVIGGRNPSRVESEDDELKGFDRTIAVRATGGQSTAYNSMVKSTAAAIEQLHGLQELLRKETSPSQFSSSSRALDQALEKARNENKQFLDSFSKLQHSGLKEITLKLVKADADVAQQANLLDRKIADAHPDIPEVVGSAKSLDQALENFHEQQFALGDEMGIETPAGGQDLTFNLSPVSNSIELGDQPVAITVAGTLSKVATGADQSVFKLELTADLSGLQQDITKILRSKLDKSDRCGERVEIQRATLSAQDPAGLVVTQLHFERWACFPAPGGANELAEGNGTVAVKLTPVVEHDSTLRLVPQVERVDADGSFGEQLRSGPLGEALREEVTRLLLRAVQAVLSFKAALPAAVQEDAVLQKAEFREAAGLRVTLAGRLRISEQQVKLLASQLETHPPDR